MMPTRPLPLLATEPIAAPVAPFSGLTSLWIQGTGTWCNLACTHCLNSSGPRDPWLRPLAPAVVERAIADGERLGVKEIYFTGGEPFLHDRLLAFLAQSLAVAPTTVLTNGTLLTPERADALCALADGSRYSLEIRVSLDDVDEARNDAIRGAGAWAHAVGAIRLLDARGILPIVTATRGTYRDFRDFLLSIGIAKPRVKLLPVFALGRLEDAAADRLTDEDLDGFDRATLPCAETRVVADGGIYACPILAGLPGARLSDELAESFRPAPLFHPACVTCRRTGMTCANG